MSTVAAHERAYEGETHVAEHVPTTTSSFRLRTERRPGPVTTILGYQLVGLLLACFEIGHRWIGRLDVSGVAIPQTLVMLVAAGSVLGVSAAGIGALQRKARVRADLFYPLLAAPALFWLGTRLFGGPWISKQWPAPYGPFALTLVGVLSIASLIRTLRARTNPPAAVLALSALAVGFATVDLAFLPGLYNPLHAATLLFSWITGGQAAALVLASLAQSWDRLRSGTFMTASAALLMLSIPVAVWKSPNRTHRELWVQSPGFAVQVYDPAHLLYWLYQVRRSGTGGYADVVAAWVQRQSDRNQLGREAAERSWKEANLPSARARRARAAARSERPNIVMVTVDALRADVAAQGAVYPALAARGRQYLRAYSPTASTDRSLPQVLSGAQMWQRHEANIIRALNADGYDTAFVTDAVVREALRYRDQSWLDDPGTLIPVDKVAGRSAAAITAHALEFLRTRRSDKPLFLWVHYFDVHEWKEITEREHSDTGSARARYERIWRDEEEQVGALLSNAERLLATRPTALIMTSDHGEYLGELGRVAHGRWVEAPVTRVPLVVVADGVTPRKVGRPVSTFDIAPTIAELAQLPSFSCEAVSLLREDAEVDPLRPLIMSEVREIGIVRGPHRLVLSPASYVIRLYDDADPFQPKQLSMNDLPDYRTRLLLPLLGSPAAAASASPVRIE
jgi:hypothetical protein